MPNELSRPAPIEIKIANVGLVPKLDALSAALEAVVEAHRDEMGPEAWGSLHQARDCIAHAILVKNRGRRIQR